MHTMLHLGQQAFRRATRGRFLPRWRSRRAASDTVTHGSWIIVAVGLAVLAAGVLAVPGSPVHRWLAAGVGGISRLTAHAITFNGQTAYPGGLAPSGWLATPGITLASGSYDGTPVLAAQLPQDSATQSYANQLRANPTMTASPVPTSVAVGTAQVTVSLRSAAAGWEAYPSTGSHAAHFAITYVPSGSTALTWVYSTNSVFSLYGSFTTTTFTTTLPTFAIRPQSITIVLSDDPQDAAFTWDITSMRASIQVTQ